jgi:mannan endo-1,4-beta-mannosidase
VVQEPLPVTPSDPGKVTAREAVLADLEDLIARGLCASGQNIGHVDAGLDPSFMDLGGRVPAVLGLDLGFDYLTRDFSEAVDLAAAHAAAGGWVELSFHAPNPRTSGDSWDRTVVDFRELARPGSSLNRVFFGLVSNLANILQELENRDVIVFLRPLHEMNGGWFWWGSDRSWPDPADWSALWKQMHEYLRGTRQLDNVLFVYAPHVRFSEESKPVDYYYPGDEYVDAVGLDYYSDSLAEYDMRDSLVRAATLGKPLGFGEVGSASHRATFDHRQWAGLADLGVGSFVVWHSWPGHAVALRDASHGADLLADPAILDREELSGR